MGYIYKITNQVNGKIYIGQTYRTVELRWKEHLSHINGRYPINRAIKKYTPFSFKIETIEQCDDSHLDEREIYWIAFYHSNNAVYGYNCTAGGMGSKKIDYNEVYALWDKGLGTGEIFCLQQKAIFLLCRVQCAKLSLFHQRLKIPCRRPVFLWFQPVPTKESDNQMFPLPFSFLLSMLLFHFQE